MATAAAAAAAATRRRWIATVSTRGLRIPKPVEDAHLSRLVAICSQKLLLSQQQQQQEESDPQQQQKSDFQQQQQSQGESEECAFASVFHNTANLMLFFLDHGIPRYSLSSKFRSIPSLAAIPYDHPKFLRILCLLRTLGDDHAVHKIIRCSPDIFAKHPDQLRKTISDLRSLSVDDALLARRPCFLRLTDVHKMTRLLHLNGVSAPAFGKVLKRWRGAADLNLDKLRTKVNLLAKFGVTGKNLERFIIKYPWFLKSDKVGLEECYPLLKKHGIEGDRFARMVAFHPGTLRLSEESLQAAQGVLVAAGLGPETEIYKSALTVAALTNPKVLESRISRYLQYGFSTGEAQEMLRKQPRLLRISDRFLELKMRFLLHCVKLPRESMIRSPNYLLYSLDKRLKPRFLFASTVLLHGGFRTEVGWKGVFYFSESRFVEVFKRFSPEALAVYRKRLAEKKDPTRLKIKADRVSKTPE